MTSIRTTPARVRTDAAPAAAPAPAAVSPTAPTEAVPTVGSAPGSGSPGVRAPGERGLRALGAGLAAGSAFFGVAWLVLGPVADVGSFAIDAGGIAFQAGVFCLLIALWRTRGTGIGRFGRGVLVTEAVLLAVATVQSFAAAAARGGQWGTLATVLDPSWPLSMLGMVVVGITVAVVGRWRGALRVWAPVAGSWLVVGLVGGMLLPASFQGIVIGGHFLLGYTVLGLLLAVRPELTRR
ncbi:hypothetical protein [Actinomycetospora straminea]|uniref:DUF308 domain-containing protein n=1 Tax=Actinomycetospora straminea TaxID=663607 RepID=A0ABP9DXY1_9PSEU|nr:hypothetical protein [Actinomycetospora straminea]MDD7932272.1 hypothetical protein [Actinomycetospora straminea]